MDADEFRDHMLSLAAKAEPATYPRIRYDPDGDCLEVLFEAGSYYGEYKDQRLTVYRERESDRIIGCIIEGLHPIIKKR